MSFLLDTHVWIWTQESPDRLGRKARKAIETTTEQVCVATIATL
ncbi:type II toxin-antitoxin system VapC family toxin, partial [bacterium]|nr:type II toxin-antitoxin system VapC family toxin [bacterium]